jgi:hypothetical protein
VPILLQKSGKEAKAVEIANLLLEYFGENDVGRIEHALVPLARAFLELHEALSEVPDTFVKHFMENRRWYAARNIDIVSRKDAAERWLEGD